MISTKIVITNFSENYENCRLCSSKFKWWKMFSKSLDSKKFWIIKVASFEISNPDSLRVTFIRICAYETFENTDYVIIMSTD